MMWLVNVKNFKLVIIRRHMWYVATHRTCHCIGILTFIGVRYCVLISSVLVFFAFLANWLITLPFWAQHLLGLLLIEMRRIGVRYRGVWKQAFIEQFCKFRFQAFFKDLSALVMFRAEHALNSCSFMFVPILVKRFFGFWLVVLNVIW